LLQRQLDHLAAGDERNHVPALVRGARPAQEMFG
jgi:hypothetical protein